MISALRQYALVTIAYWAFTLSDGALRMLVLLHFHALGYHPVQLAFLFLFYEFAGVVTNLVGGWIAVRLGLKATLVGGLAIQVGALGMLSAMDPAWSTALSVAWAMGAQALSGIAKDLTKMSAKSAIKSLVPEDARSTLFRWVAVLTGSKNALKGVGFFLGGYLLSQLGYRDALWLMAGALVVVLLGTALLLPPALGQAKAKPPFSALFAQSRDINVLAVARFFLFGSRDVWFVVGVPIFLASTLGWSFTGVGSFLATWVIGYGVVQAIAPSVVGLCTGGTAPQGRAALVLALLLAAVMAAVALALGSGIDPRSGILIGLGVYGVVFALNSSVHSYLILAYSNGDKVALNVGFYYMANAGGRLVGTLLSGLTYQWGGLQACLWTAFAFTLATALVSALLPVTPPVALSGFAGEVGD
ncbi:MAG: organoarsenical effux MFS transporter ArsJ [Planctomycetes bacterium]|nr:organoarsenical effux MFS transporter ArsJ [Planctomycetota bacterium]